MRSEMVVKNQELEKLISARDHAKRHCGDCGGFIEAPEHAIRALTCMHCNTIFCPPCGFKHFGEHAASMMGNEYVARRGQS